MRMQRIIATMMILFMFFACGQMAVAAPADEATIDVRAKGSITIYKYDETSAREDQVFNDSYVSVGETNVGAETLYADYAIEGVEFTYLKIADIATYSTVVDSAGNASVQLVYGLNQRTFSVFSQLGLETTDAVRVDSAAGLYYFASDALIDFLADANGTMPVTTKNTLESFVRTNSGTALELTDDSGKTVADDLNLGLYLLVETAVPEQVTVTTAPFLVSVPMTNFSGDTWVYDITVYPKNLTGMPEIKKEVAEVTSAPVQGNYSTAVSASMGDKVAYRITSILPLITSEATHLSKYTFVDTLEAGLTYVQNDVLLTWYDEAGSQVAKWAELNQYFTVTYQGNRMTVSMTEEGLAHINPENSDHDGGLSGCTLVIDYKATVDSNDEVILGDAGNGNSVTLEWRRSSMDYTDTLTAGENGETSENGGKAPAVYTYGVELTKLFSDGNGDATQVQFVVFNDTDGYYLTAHEAADGLYYVTGTVGAAEADATVFRPAADGMLNIYGMEADTYLVTELETAGGYTLLKDNIVIHIGNERSQVVCTAQECYHEEHEFLTANAAVNNDVVTMKNHGESENAIVPLTVINERGYQVPATGDGGTFILPLFGILGACGLGIAAVMMRRRRV